MKVKDLTSRLECFPGSQLAVSDFSNKKMKPICVRKDTNRVVIDVVPESVAAIRQPGVDSVDSSELHYRLSKFDRELPVVISDYYGSVIDPVCVRQDSTKMVHIDIDGLL